MGVIIKFLFLELARCFDMLFATVTIPGETSSKESHFSPSSRHPADATGFAVFFRESASDIVYAPQATLRKKPHSF